MVDDGKLLPLDCYVVLHIRAGPPFPGAPNPEQIAADYPFRLSDDIWIERFDEPFAINIQRACEPANYKTVNHVRDRHVYAFVRREPEGEKIHRRKPGSVVRDEGIIPLFTVIALSRLVHPTTTGNRYCAKIYPFPVNDPVIQALTVGGANPDVTFGDVAYDWLSPSHGEELRQLMVWVDEARPMLKRVHHALWKHEDAARTYFLDSRFPTVVAGLEALITVEQYKTGARFVRRVGQLASEFGIVLTETELTQAFDLRSALAHGQSFLYDLREVLPPDEQPPLYNKLERLLRCVVKRCLLDVEFCARFQDDQSVKEAYP